MAFLRAPSGGPCTGLLVVSSVLFLPGALTGAEMQQEYGVKAAYLANLFSYVEWPPGHAAQKTICVLGRDPFGPVLERTVEKYGGSMKVRRLGEGQSPGKQCSLLFVAQGTPRRLSSVVESALDEGVLTVSESQDESEVTGVIVLETNDQDRRIRVAVRADSAAQHGFHISSRLLAIARIIPNRRGPR
jgi:hypothetical protein